jgi:N-acetyl-alpha-D-muramate 1-phosphate uridylyltransferase
MAAGLGLRMRPLTETMPKPMIAVGGVPMIDRALDWLASSGVTEAVVNTHYKAEMMEAHLSRRTRPRVRISREEVLLETGGGIKKALPMLGKEPFFSLNSDAICLDGATPALTRLRQAWRDETMDALLLVQPLERAIGYDGKGDFMVDDLGAIRRRGGSNRAPYVFTGVQILHPRLFADAPEGAFSLNVLYNLAIRADGALDRVRAVVHDGDWLHIGDPEGLKKAEAFFFNRRASA